MYERIGAHGESIGGMVACSIAKNNDLCFLFADRTFSSLTELVNSRIRLVNKTCFFCISRWNDCCCEDFIEAGCYKVLSCDPKDEIIPEKSSLKAGVLALQNCFQLEKEIFVNFLDAILSVSDLIRKLNPHNAKSQRDSSEITHNSMYISIGKEMDLMDDEEVTSILFKIFKALEIDAGGVCLFDVGNENELKM